MSLEDIPTGQLPGTPEDFGFPAKFSRWRVQQEFAIDEALRSLGNYRFISQCIPTGVGKSLIYVAIAYLMGWRAAILTSTKALQDQLDSDFGVMGMVTLKGKNAYPCHWLDDVRQTVRQHTCEQGAAACCPLRHSTKCPARLAIEEAKRADLVSVNYAMFMSVNEFIGGIGKFDLLILDEGHDAETQVCGHLACEWRETDSRAFDDLTAQAPNHPSKQDPKSWREWASTVYTLADGAIEDLKESAQRSPGDTQIGSKVVSGSRVVRKLKRLSAMSADWIAEIRKGYHGPAYWAFDAVWAEDYTEDYLFLNIPRVLLTSATLAPKTSELLGIKPNDVEHLDYDATFPRSRGPVYHLPTAPVKFNMSPESWDFIVETIADLMDSRPDRRGIIHSVSYKRRDTITTDLRNLSPETAGRLATHTRARDLQESLALFWNGPRDTAFISPSVRTGHDFKYRRAEWQIICKVPFPDTRNRVVQERSKQDSDYPMYLAILELVQACGRIMRAEDDRGETFIIDDNVGWLLYYYQDLVPPSFHYKRIGTIPKAPPTLEIEGIGDIDTPRRKRVRKPRRGAIKRLYGDA